MKKIICLMLAAMFLVSTAFAENTTTEFGEWRVSAHVDEFEIPTGNYCAVRKEYSDHPLSFRRRNQLMNCFERLLSEFFKSGSVIQSAEGV